MTTLRFYIEGERAGPKFQRATQRLHDRVLSSSRLAAQDVAADIEKKGRADIVSAGNFGSRWTNGFKVSVTEGGGSIRIAATEDVPYWSVFQYGKEIKGNPLLWIPFSFADDAQGVSLKDYPGNIFFTTRKDDGLPMAGSADTGELKYFGKESVTIPKKFHLVEIVTEGARNFRDFYVKRFKQWRP